MAERPDYKKRQTFFNAFMGVGLKAIFTLVIALVISIVIEIVGMHFWWEEQGVTHSQKMYEYELRQLGGGVGVDLSAKQEEVVLKIYETQEKIVNVISLSQNRTGKIGNSKYFNNTFFTIIKNGAGNFEKYLDASLNIVKVFSLRLAILILSLPLFVAALVIGLADGLVERDLRRWGAGRESSDIFDIAAAAVGPMAIGAWVIYLSIPFSISPNAIIIPFVFLFGMSVRITAERLKKYF